MVPERKSAAAASLKKLMAVGAILMGRGFSASKCKTEVKMATARIKLLRNRREAQIRQMKRDIAALLNSGQASTARIRVEHVIREQNVMAANEIIELFCELVVTRLSIIAKQRNCPADLKEGISSLIFAAPRCSEIPELSRIRDSFEKKYGKEFVFAAMELRPNSGVNKTLIEKLSVRTPLGEVKLKVLKEIAKEHQIQWDHTESEQELLKPPEERIDGPMSFQTTSSMPVNMTYAASEDSPETAEWRASAEKDHGNGQPGSSISAAQAAADLAEKAVAVAQAAADFAKQASRHANHNRNLRRSADTDARDYEPCSDNSHGSFGGYKKTSQSSNSNPVTTRRFVDSCADVNLSKDQKTNHDVPRCPDDGIYSRSASSDDDVSSMHLERRSRRMDIHKQRPLNSDIKFDDSDGLVESDRDEEEQPSHPPPQSSSSENTRPEVRGSAEMDITQKQNSRVHPKLPDYESLAARFEALKTRRSSS